MKFRARAGLFACLLFSIASHYPAAAEECVKTVRWNDAPPYSTLGPDGQIHGSEADLVREALQRMGCVAKFVDLPWSRALDDLRRGRLDILPGVFRNPERDAFALFSKPVNRTRNIVFVTREFSERRRAKGLADLVSGDVRLGYVEKADYGDQWKRSLRGAGVKASLVPIVNRPSVWQVMSANRLDAMVDDEVSGLLEIAAKGFQADIIPSGIIVSDRPDQIAFSRVANTPEFVGKFDRVLEEMKQDGRFLAVLQHYRPCKVSLAALGCE